MKLAGVLLLVIGTLLAVICAAGPIEQARLRAGIAAGLGLMVAGIVLRRIGARRSLRRTGTHGGVTRALQAVEDILACEELLDQLAQSPDGRQFRERIRRIIEHHAEPFHQSSQHILDAFGVLLWSEIVGDFARGERWLHRAESASADGVHGETPAALSAAFPWFRECHSRLRRVAAHSDS